MASSRSVLQFRSSSVQPLTWTSKPRISPNFLDIRRECCQMKSNRSVTKLLFQFRAVSNSINSTDEVHQIPVTNNALHKLQSVISTLPPVVLLKRRQAGSNFVVWLCITTAILVVAIRVYVVRNTRSRRPPGSVADLVRRGQLRSDRRGITRPLKYDDPFNNPLIKVGKSNSTVEMCGKVYRLAPVTLTKEQQAIHQKRRSRAYQWKRPTVFLKEGDTVPPDVDPDTVRWIPANHPFATTANDIDEDLAQTNVYQKHGVPFRIQAEHEALKRKLEALQQDQKLDKLIIDTTNAKAFERQFKSNPKSNEPENSLKNEAGGPKLSKSDSARNPSDRSSSPEETQKQ